MAISDLSDYLTAAKAVIDIFKSIKNELPQGPEADRSQEQIERAEKALKAAEAQLAKELGYKLCQCTFPPQIMLSVGRHPTYDKEIFSCPNCQKQEPSEHHFQRLDARAAQNQHRSSRGSWADARHRR